MLDEYAYLMNILIQYIDMYILTQQQTNKKKEKEEELASPLNLVRPNIIAFITE